MNLLTCADFTHMSMNHWIDHLSSLGARFHPDAAAEAEDFGRVLTAADLAAGVDREKLPFKVDVRKLKERGLTESLDVGYRLSPRGRLVLDHIHRSNPT